MPDLGLDLTVIDTIPVPVLPPTDLSLQISETQTSKGNGFVVCFQRSREIDSNTECNLQ